MPSFQLRWTDYYQAVTVRPPRKTLLTALKHFDDELISSCSGIKFAVDLGCGNGFDTLELLQRNWRVLAVDGETEAIIHLHSHQSIDLTYLETRVQKFEDLILPTEVDLINASFCLPFCSPNHFSTLWKKIEISLKPGGRFCGHLFGDKDFRAAFPEITIHKRKQVDQLLASFEVELFNEEEYFGKLALGEEKYWHLYQIVARKH